MDAMKWQPIIWKEVLIKSTVSWMALCLCSPCSVYLFAWDFMGDLIHLVEYATFRLQIKFHCYACQINTFFALYFYSSCTLSLCSIFFSLLHCGIQKALSIVAYTIIINRRTSTCVVWSIKRNCESVDNILEPCDLYKVALRLNGECVFVFFCSAVTNVWILRMVFSPVHWIK